MLIKLFHRAEENFFGNIAHKTLVSNEFNAYVTGINNADLNPSYVRNIFNIEKNINQIRSFYGNENISHNLIVPQKIYQTNLFKKNNYKNVGCSIAMAAIIENKVTNIEKQDYIVKHNNDLLDWMIPVSEGFGATEDIIKQYRQLYISILGKNLNFKHFCLYVNQELVAALTLSINNNYARIDDVATIPKYQGNGYATYLITHIMNLLQKTRIRYCFLEANVEAASLYTKCGFKELYMNCIFQNY